MASRRPSATVPAGGAGGAGSAGDGGDSDGGLQVVDDRGRGAVLIAVEQLLGHIRTLLKSALNREQAASAADSRDSGRDSSSRDGGNTLGAGPVLDVEKAIESLMPVLVAQSVHDARFHRYRLSRLLRTWLEAAVGGAVAEWVRVAEASDETLGVGLMHVPVTTFVGKLLADPVLAPGIHTLLDTMVAVSTQVAPVTNQHSSDLASAELDARQPGNPNELWGPSDLTAPVGESHIMHTDAFPDDESQHSDGALSFSSFSCMPAYDKILPITGAVLHGPSLAARQEALASLIAYSPGDLLHSEFWPDVQQSLASAIASDASLAVPALDYMARLFREASHVSAMQTAELVHIMTAHLLKHCGVIAVNLGASGSILVPELLLRKFRLTLLMLVELPDHWVRLPDHLYDVVVVGMLALLRTRTSTRDSLPGTGSRIQLSASQILALLDPQAQWFCKWLAEAKPREQMTRYIRAMRLLEDLLLEFDPAKPFPAITPTAVANLVTLDHVVYSHRCAGLHMLGAIIGFAEGRSCLPVVAPARRDGVATAVGLTAAEAAQFCAVKGEADRTANNRLRTLPRIAATEVHGATRNLGSVQSAISGFAQLLAPTLALDGPKPPVPIVQLAVRVLVHAASNGATAVHVLSALAVLVEPLRSMMSPGWPRNVSPYLALGLHGVGQIVSAMVRNPRGRPLLLVRLNEAEPTAQVLVASEQLAVIAKFALLSLMVDPPEPTVLSELPFECLAPFLRALSSLCRSAMGFQCLSSLQLVSALLQCVAAARARGSSSTSLSRLLRHSRFPALAADCLLDCSTTPLGAWCVYQHGGLPLCMRRLSQRVLEGQAARFIHRDTLLVAAAVSCFEAGAAALANSPFASWLLVGLVNTVRSNPNLAIEMSSPIAETDDVCRWLPALQAMLAAPHGCGAVLQLEVQDESTSFFQSDSCLEALVSRLRGRQVSAGLTHFVRSCCTGDSRRLPLFEEMSSLGLQLLSAAVYPLNHRLRIQTSWPEVSNFGGLSAAQVPTLEIVGTGLMSGSGSVETGLLTASSASTQETVAPTTGGASARGSPAPSRGPTRPSSVSSHSTGPKPLGTASATARTAEIAETVEEVIEASGDVDESGGVVEEELASDEEAAAVGSSTEAPVTVANLLRLRVLCGGCAVGGPSEVRHMPLPPYPAIPFGLTSIPTVGDQLIGWALQGTLRASGSTEATPNLSSGLLAFPATSSDRKERAQTALRQHLTTELEACPDSAALFDAYARLIRTVHGCDGGADVPRPQFEATRTDAVGARLVMQYAKVLHAVYGRSIEFAETDVVSICGGVHFDWFSATIMLLCGSAATAAGWQASIVAQPWSRVFVAQPRMEAGQVPPLLVVGHLVEALLLEEFPQIANALLVSGCSAAHVSMTWVSQWFWNYLDFGDIARCTAIVTVLGAEYLIWLVVAILEQLQEPIVAGANQQRVHEVLVLQPLQRIKWNSAIATIGRLSARYGAFCREQLGSLDADMHK